MSSEKSLLVICKILRLFFNTLTTDDQYSLLKRDNLTKPIQIQISKKQKIFFQFFYALLKSTSNFEHFEKRDYPWNLCISQIMDCKRRGYRHLLKVPFIRPFDKQHGKRSQTLLKSAQQHLYQIYWSWRGKLSWRKSLLALFLTHWLPMTSILNKDNLTHQFRCNYLNSKNLFVNVFLRFRNLYQILNIKKKQDDPHSLHIFKNTDYGNCCHINV